MAKAAATEKFEVRNRWSNEVQFTAEITCAADTPPALKLGLAVKWGASNGANLVGARLVGANLVGANLDGARLDGANLDGANLYGARLDGANLDGARLVGARLVGANLDGANLYGARLDGANLYGARLVGARLVGANLGENRGKIEKVVAIACRLDGYAFYGFRMQGGALKILAGCRFFTPDEFRKHVAGTYPGTSKASETLSIVEHIERMAALYAPVEAKEAAE